MRPGAAVVSLLLVCLPAAAQHFHQHADPSSAEQGQFRRSPCSKPQYTPPPLDSGWQKVQLPVTGKDTARQYFSQGLTEYYGFNFEAAVRNFKAALGNDSAMAMAAWGVALASGPNININMQGQCADDAVSYSRQAVNLSKTQPGITKLERDLIDALALRYQDGLDNVAYAVALRAIWNNARTEPDLTSLYAESILDLRPWGLFDNAKRPALDTTEVIAALKTTRTARASSVGVNHLLIHAVEAGPSPDDAREAANVLADLVPKSGHLVHMPSHVHMLLGNYSVAADFNTRAVKADEDAYATPCRETTGKDFETYWNNPDCQAVYYGHYLGHNHFFRSVAAAFAGRSGDALDSARKTSAHVKRFVVNEPGLQRYLTAPLMMLAAHQRWEEVIAEPAPEAGCYAQPPFLEDTGCHIVRAIRHWARGVAYAAREKNRCPDCARDEYVSMTAEMKKIEPPTPTGWGNNTAAAVLGVPEEILLARIAWAGNQKENAIERLKLAVTHEDAMVYDEPPQWFAPAREALGGAYLQAGDCKLDRRPCELARDTFLAALDRHPKSGRALYGLMLAYEGLGENVRAAEIKTQFNAAWNGIGDYAMDVQKLW